MKSLRNVATVALIAVVLAGTTPSSAYAGQSRGLKNLLQHGWVKGVCCGLLAGSLVVNVYLYNNIRQVHQEVNERLMARMTSRDVNKRLTNSNERIIYFTTDGDTYQIVDGEIIEAKKGQSLRGTSYRNSKLKLRGSYDNHILVQTFSQDSTESEGEIYIVDMINDFRGLTYF